MSNKLTYTLSLIASIITVTLLSMLIYGGTLGTFAGYIIVGTVIFGFAMIVYLLIRSGKGN